MLSFIYILYSVIHIANAQFYSSNDTSLVIDISESLIKYHFENKLCYEDIQKVIKGIQNLELWALKLLDSSGKLGSGVLSGNIKMLGHYDQCVTQESRDLTAQYCLATLHVTPLPQARRNKQLQQLIDVATLGRAEYEMIKEENRPVPDMLSTLSHIQFGICVPSSCTNNDVKMLLNSALKYLETFTELEVSATISKNSCSVLHSIAWTSGDFIFISIIGMLVALSAISTFYDVSKGDTKSTSYLHAFSLRNNWYQLVRTDHPSTFTSLDGIRVLSTLWVILSHKIGFYTLEPWVNKDKVFESVSSIAAMPLVNNMLAVDTFFTISGLLRGYTLSRELESAKHQFLSSAWKRYLRLTPPVAVMLGFYMTLAPRLGSGPYWDKIVTSATSQVCRTNWIYNLLYLNNYIHHDKFCVGQTWYLAADMHLFIFAPLLIYPAWKWPDKASKIFSLAISVATLIPFLTILYTSVLPTYLPSGSNFDFLSYQSLIHIPTHQRAAAYIIGLGCGIILFKSTINKVELSKIKVFLGWITSLIILNGIIYGPYRFFQYDYKYEVLEMSIYGALHRPAWAVAIAWIVFASYTGYGGWINKLLSFRIFLPLSRLCYCIYLTHFIVLKISTGKIKTASLVDDYDLVRQFIGDLFFISISAIFLHIFVEAPTLELVKTLQKTELNISRSSWMDWMERLTRNMTEKTKIIIQTKQKSK